MLGATVVPQHRVALAPAMAIDEAILLREFLEISDDGAAFLRWHPLDVAGPAPYIERDAPGSRMAPD